MPHFDKTLVLPVSSAEAFAYLTHPLAFTRLNPPWEKVRIIKQTGGVENGAQLDMQVQLAPGVWTRWLAQHQDYIPGQQFVDVQVTGPFAQWVHTHRIDPVTSPENAQASQLTDAIQYALPFDWITGWVGYVVVRQKLNAMFAYRHSIMAVDLALPAINRSVLVSSQLNNKAALSALLAIKGAKLCQYADENPDVAILAKGELAGRNLRNANCLSAESLPTLPESHPVFNAAVKAALRGAWGDQVELYKVVLAVNSLTI